ncbi:MAG: AAA domain-containing protein [Mangrovibacterium sp.]
MAEITSPLVDLLHQYKLLQQEYEFEKNSFYEQTRQDGISKRIREGVCWYPVAVVKNYYNSLNQLVIEIKRDEAAETDHQFDHGRPVCFFANDGTDKSRYFKFSATIGYIKEDLMMVILPHTAALAELQSTTNLGVQLFFDGTTYKTMLSALTEVMEAKEGRLAYLREVLLGNVRPQQRELSSIGFTWLNRSQEKAVNQVLRAKEVSVIHGPPGTGKTTTLVEAVYETLRRENQVLVCAQSNLAVDWISEKLLDRGVNVLRIGNPTRVNEKMLSFTYEKRFESHPCYPALRNARKAFREASTRLKNSQGTKRKSVRNQLHELKDQVVRWELLINKQLFGESRAIACTLIGASHKLLNGKRFSTLFIDEASQALEAACWVAIAKSDRIILAGDPSQLPPTIKCYEAAKEGLDRTLIQRLKQRKPETVTMLDIQYRMHEIIMRFPSFWFYRNQLKAAPEVSQRHIPNDDAPIAWYDTADCEFTEETMNGNLGRINKSEAKLMVSQLQYYIEKIGADRVMDERIDFGVISPYRLQVQYIRQLIKGKDFFQPFRRLITIHTVDGFQGQERDVIFISLVRANNEGNIGFLNDLRRMNVAITRARMKLIIYGDAPTLTRHPFYKALYRYIQNNGKVVILKPDFQVQG